MEILNNWISGINDLLWSYVLIIMLLGCAFRFTFKTRFVQFRMFREMIRVLGDSANKAHEGEKHISSFQAFAVSLASRVGTGNLAGVATAIAVGGPGAVFWMWIIALLGSASAFVESTLAQLYKRKGKESFIGGPAYYMRYGLGLNWMGILFAILISVTFGFAFNSVQSNTICAAMQGSFGFDPRIVGAVLTVLTLAIIFGGIQRIAKVSSVIVPVMALGYVALASGIVLFNITELPAVIKLIVSSAFGWEQAAGGTIGTGSGAFAALLFVLVLFLLYRPTAKRRIAKDRSGSVDSYRQISRIFFFTVIPVIVSSGVYNINSVIDNGIMAHGMESLGRGKEFLALWGIYNNKYMLLVHVPLAMANSLSSSLIPSLSGAIARKDRKAAIEKTALAIRFAMLIAIPSAVGLTVLSAPVNNLLFRGGNNAEAIRMMMIGASAVIFLSLSTVTNAILQGLNRMNVPVRNALISLALHVIALYIMLMIFNMGIYSMVFASILFALFMCILNAIAIRNTLGYRQEMVKTFLLPAISAAFMGAAAYGVYRGVTLVIHSNVLGTLLAVLVAVAVYGVLLIKLHCIEEDEMYSMPMGRKLTRICRKLHLM